MNKWPQQLYWDATRPIGSHCAYPAIYLYFITLARFLIDRYPVSQLGVWFDEYTICHIWWALCTSLEEWGDICFIQLCLFNHIFCICCCIRIIVEVYCMPAFSTLSCQNIDASLQVQGICLGSISANREAVICESFFFPVVKCKNFDVTNQSVNQMCCAHSSLNWHLVSVLLWI